MRHRATREFWTFFDRLPDEIQELARKNFKLLNDDPAHPSLHFKYAGAGWSVRIGRKYRALATKRPDGYAWLWIGPHEEYMRRLKEMARHPD